VHDAVQTTLERWGFAMPVGNGEQRNSTRSEIINDSDIPTANITPITDSTSNQHVPARQYYNKVQPLKYSIESYIGQGTNNNTNTTFISNSKKWKSQLYGDKTGVKNNDKCRIISHNINCIGINTITNPKLNTAKEWIYANEVDICGWQEIGVGQHMMQRH